MIVEMEREKLLSDIEAAAPGSIARAKAKALKMANQSPIFFGAYNRALTYIYHEITAGRPEVLNS